MIQVPDHEYQRLRQLSSELEALLRRVHPGVDPVIDEQVAAFVATRDQWQARSLYLSLRPLLRRQVAASLRRLGWSKVRRSTGYVWIKRSAVSPDPPTSP